jgi:hypothetical protein
LIRLGRIDDGDRWHGDSDRRRAARRRSRETGRATDAQQTQARRQQRRGAAVVWLGTDTGAGTFSRRDGGVGASLGIRRGDGIRTGDGIGDHGGGGLRRSAVGLGDKFVREFVLTGVDTAITRAWRRGAR